MLVPYYYDTTKPCICHFAFKRKKHEKGDKMDKNTVLGVLGGMGPMATAYFFELVTAHTPAKRDQDHIDVVISSRASTPDRSPFILGDSSVDPFPVLLDSAKNLVLSGAGVIAIPCNTAHYFYDQLAANLPVPVLHMIEGVVLRARQSGARKLGLLATDGTVKVGVYQSVCDRMGMPLAVPDADGQQAIMHVIYQNIKQGLPADMDKFALAARQLFDAGCDAVVLGCTELSLIDKVDLSFGRFIDSMEVLAAMAIESCGRTPVSTSATISPSSSGE